MDDEVIAFHGSYRYADREALERALSRARAELAGEAVDAGGAWIRYFVTGGSHLTVNVSLPAAAQEWFAAANVFLILSHGALEGTVESRPGRAAPGARARRPDRG